MILIAVRFMKSNPGHITRICGVTDCPKCFVYDTEENVLCFVSQTKS